MKKTRALAKKEKEVKPKKTLLKKVMTNIRGAAKKVKKAITRRKPAAKPAMELEKELIEQEKFDNAPALASASRNPAASQSPHYSYNLPSQYGDNRIVLLPRDPWWIHTYWDITEQRIHEVVSSISEPERTGMKWIVRVYDVTGVDDFKGDNACSFFDMDITFESHSWYINVNQPERSWCLEIGFKNARGSFFAVARSNIIKTPHFGISSAIDEEWALPDEEYYKVLGLGGYADAINGKSSLERRTYLEKMISEQVSSAISSAGISSAGVSSFRPRGQEDDTFFLEVWTEIILHGRTAADAAVTVEGKPVALRTDGTFSLRYAMPVGDYRFAVVGTSANKKHTITKIPAAKRFDIVK